MNTHHTGDELAAIVAGATRQAWRFETLQAYGNSGEDERLRRFHAGEPYRPTAAKDAWLDTIRGLQARGAGIGRVHVVVEPLSDYMRYELSWGYAPNVAAGEDIRIIPVTRTVWPEELPGMGHDFWLVDDRLLLLHYARDGLWLDVEEVTDPSEISYARHVRTVALEQAVPYADYMTRHPDLLDRAAA